jgi:hypothetical protein
VQGQSHSGALARLSPFLLAIGFTASAIGVFAFTSSLGASVLGRAWHGTSVTPVAILSLGLFAFADLNLVGLHTPMWRRQTPRHLFFRFGPGIGAVLWGADTGLAFTTYRVTSIVWAAMILSALGLLPWWAGVGYALGFSMPLLVMVSVIPWRGALPRGQGGEPGWLTAKLIHLQPVARVSGSLSMLVAALLLVAWWPATPSLLRALLHL